MDMTQSQTSGLTVKDPSRSAAAAALDVSERTIDRYVKAGHLTARKLPNGHIRISQASIDAFLEGTPALAESESTGGDAA